MTKKALKIATQNPNKALQDQNMWLVLAEDSLNLGQLSMVSYIY